MAEKSRKKKSGPEAPVGATGDSPVDQGPRAGDAAAQVAGEGEAGPTTPETAVAAGADPERLLAEKEAEIGELRSQLVYQQAELENFKKRTEKRYRDMLTYAAEPLLRELLSVLDNLQRALEHGQEMGAEGYGPMVEGIGHVVQQFLDVLQRHGVCAIPTEGVRFDPGVHEAVGHVPGEEDGTVGAVCEQGYSYRQRLLRPAKVLVTKVAAGEGDG